MIYVMHLNDLYDQIKKHRNIEKVRIRFDIPAKYSVIAKEFC